MERSSVIGVRLSFGLVCDRTFWGYAQLLDLAEGAFQIPYDQFPHKTRVGSHRTYLNSLDFWFWGASKGEVYANKPTSLDQVEAYACSQCDG